MYKCTIALTKIKNDPGLIANWWIYQTLKRNRYFALVKSRQKDKKCNHEKEIRYGIFQLFFPGWSMCILENFDNQVSKSDLNSWKLYQK